MEKEEKDRGDERDGEREREINEQGRKLGGREKEKEKKRVVPRKERSCWQDGIDTRSVRAFRCAVLRALF